MRKKFLSVVLSLAMVFSFSSTAFAAETNAYGQSDIYSSELTLPESDLQFINKIVSVADYWYVNATTNELAIALTEEELKSDFNFSDAEYNRLASQIIGTYVVADGADIPVPLLYISDGALYIEYTDLVGGVFAALVVAAEAGPVALTAAITALASSFSGPVGTILGLALGFSAADMCIRILYAVATEQGIYIKPVLSYPLLEIGYF